MARGLSRWIAADETESLGAKLVSLALVGEEVGHIDAHCKLFTGAGRLGRIQFPCNPMKGCLRPGKMLPDE